MKKINIFMSRLKYGGMELSLINFLNFSNITKNNEVHLYLVYVINKELLSTINDKVKIHVLCNGTWNIINKLKTSFKILALLIKTPKSNTSICYSNHQRVLSKIARKSSTNSILFIHSDLDRYKNSERTKIKNKIQFDKFNKIICVSQKVEDSLARLYDENIKNKCFIVPNYIDGDRVIKLSKEKIYEDIDFKIPTFISIANHVEEYKNINSIIDAADTLKKAKIDFQVLLIGSGKDTITYINKVNRLNLEKYVKILGSKSNPYPYLKKSKALLFTSIYEGYGMVLDEARTLNIPIISTGSGASHEICDAGYGIVTDNIVKEMKKIIKSNHNNKITFDYKKHNNNINKMYDKIMED